MEQVSCLAHTVPEPVLNLELVLIVVITNGDITLPLPPRSNIQDPSGVKPLLFSINENTREGSNLVLSVGLSCPKQFHVFPQR